MNKIILKGTIRDIQPSHVVKDTEYDKADLIVPGKDGNEDLITIKFKKYSNVYQEGQIVSLKGNIRSYSKKLEDGKSKVDIYVFTYFDIPETDEEDREIENRFEVDGRICKIDKLRTDKNGKDSLHFILANNIFVEGGANKIDTYIPCVCFGELAKQHQDLAVGDFVTLRGRLHSRTYKKYLDNEEMEIRMAHEAVIEYME